ncbi:hypothetical protein A4X09_0g7895, partial [Tilletia walkeri]
MDQETFNFDSFQGLQNNPSSYSADKVSSLETDMGLLRQELVLIKARMKTLEDASGLFQAKKPSHSGLAS